MGISGGAFTRLGAFALVGAYLAWGLTHPDGLEASILHVITLPLGVALDRGARRWSARRAWT